MKYRRIDRRLSNVVRNIYVNFFVNKCFMLDGLFNLRIIEKQASSGISYWNLIKQLREWNEPDIERHFIFHEAFHAPLVFVKYEKPSFSAQTSMKNVLHWRLRSVPPSFSSLDQEQGERKQVNPGNVPNSSFAQYWIQFGYCPSSSLDGFRVKWVLKRIETSSHHFVLSTFTLDISCYVVLNGWRVSWRKILLKQIII